MTGCDRSERRIGPCDTTIAPADDATAPAAAAVESGGGAATTAVEIPDPALEVGHTAVAAEESKNEEADAVAAEETAEAATEITDEDSDEDETEDAAAGEADSADGTGAADEIKVANAATAKDVAADDSAAMEAADGAGDPDVADAAETDDTVHGEGELDADATKAEAEEVAGPTVCTQTGLSTETEADILRDIVEDICQAVDEGMQPWHSYLLASHLESHEIENMTSAAEEWRSFMAAAGTATAAEELRHWEDGPELPSSVGQWENELTRPELDAAFARIKKDKATREHGVGIEAYIICPEAKERLYELVQDMWRNEVYPHQLLIGSQIMIWKGKKSVNDRSGYRPITIDGSEKKLFEYCFLHRLLKECPNLLPETAFGFRSSYSRRDALAVTQYVIRRVAALNRTLSIHFGDARAAFTSVSHKTTDACLKRAKASNKTRQIFRTMYAAAQCEIRVTDPFDGTTKTSGLYDWNRGTWQGGVASPTLYVVLLNFLLRDADPDPDWALWELPTDTVNRCQYCQARIRQTETLCVPCKAILKCAKVRRAHEAILEKLGRAHGAATHRRRQSTRPHSRLPQHLQREHRAGTVLVVWAEEGNDTWWLARLTDDLDVTAGNSRAEARVHWLMPTDTDAQYAIAHDETDQVVLSTVFLALPPTSLEADYYQLQREHRLQISDTVTRLDDEALEDEEARALALAGHAQAHAEQPPPSQTLSATLTAELEARLECLETQMAAGDYTDHPALLTHHLQTYADDLLQLATDAATNAARATKLAQRAWQFADVEFELTKSGHLMCRGLVDPGRTTWADVVAADFAQACDTCPRKFPGVGSLKAHSRRCKHAKHTCTRCPLAFPSTSALSEHTKRCRSATLQEPGRQPKQHHEVLSVSDSLGPPSWRFYRVRWAGEHNAPPTTTDDGTTSSSWIPAWHLHGKNSATATSIYWEQQKLVNPAKFKARGGELERPDTYRCHWCNSLRHTTTAQLAAHTKTCSWKPSPIVRTSLTHQAVQADKLQRLQRQSETMTMAGHTVPNTLHEKELGQWVSYDGTSDYDVKMRLAIADAQCYRIRWIWRDRELTFEHKKHFYERYVQVAMAGFESWYLTHGVKGKGGTIRKIKVWNAQNLTRMMNPTKANWHATFEDQLQNPALDLVGLLQSRRLEWLGQILCQPSDRLFRQEILRLALAKREGVQRTEATLLELVPGGDNAYRDPQDLVRLAGDLTTRRTLQEMTPAARAAAELRQREWAAEVHKLRGLSYDPTANDQADRDNPDSEEDDIDLTPAQLAKQVADRAAQAKKELDNRNKIMAAYALKLNSLPDESLLIYTDGGWTQPGDDQDEECGWGYTVRIRYRAYPQAQVTAGTYHPEQISRDWGNGWQVELNTRWGPVSTDTADTATYVGALHLSNNTAELTAAIQVMLYFAALYEQADRDTTVPRPPSHVLIISDSTYTINAAIKQQMPCGRESPNVAIITVLREAQQWVLSQGTTIDWQHVKGHAKALGMVSDNGVQGSPGNEAADTCATHGKRGTQPRTTGSIHEMMALMSSTRPVRALTDGSQAAPQDAGTTVANDDSGTQDASGSNGTKVHGYSAQEGHEDVRADDLRPNMHRAISGAIWGASMSDQAADSGEEDTDGDCITH